MRFSSKFPFIENTRKTYFFNHSEVFNIGVMVNWSDIKIKNFTLLLRKTVIFGGKINYFLKNDESGFFVKSELHLQFQPSHVGTPPKRVSKTENFIERK
jgi:hypothetical protein